MTKMSSKKSELDGWLVKGYCDLDRQLRKLEYENIQLRAKIARIKKNPAYTLFDKMRFLWAKLSKVPGFSGGSANEKWAEDLKQFILPVSFESGIKKFNVGVHVHAYFLDCFLEIIQYLNNIPFNYACYITTDTEEKQQLIIHICENFLHEKQVTVLLAQNRGRDIGPWIVEMAPYNDKHDIWCHVHTKKSLHLEGNGDAWRRYLLENLCGSPDYIYQLVSELALSPSLGLIFPPFYRSVQNQMTEGWEDRDKAESFLRKLGFNAELPEKPVFSAGTMLWYRREALAPLFNLGLGYDSFEAEEQQLKGTLMHIIERCPVYVSQSLGLHYRQCINGAYFERSRDTAKLRPV